ncbi:uncharacterized protein LY89DRAFT_670035 [Mollisia scopiformis]|uniref:BRCT domain-containing protein n=1 Tax=Mollisia scopiformis TaxID=149040 RepID=A0A194X8M7_MOLSC|nr:uncharacterized protein LY89DRAFT_670035 [Mollisia scopiformis]KUJ16528.1 hypothetical protein LY89DRAFT_670035 [Mollisia scopiformis]
MPSEQMDHYLVKRRYYKRAIDLTGNEEVVGGYYNLEDANRRAEAEAQRLYAGTDKTSTEPPRNVSYGVPYCAFVGLNEARGYYSVVVYVIKVEGLKEPKEEDDNVRVKSEPVDDDHGRSVFTSTTASSRNVKTEPHTNPAPFPPFLPQGRPGCLKGLHYAFVGFLYNQAAITELITSCGGEVHPIHKLRLMEIPAPSSVIIIKGIMGGYERVPVDLGQRAPNGPCHTTVCCPEEVFEFIEAGRDRQ